jgi:hypothetical protein
MNPALSRLLPGRARRAPRVDRSALRDFALALVLTTLAAELPAFEASDPFATRAITPARPAPTVAGVALPSMACSKSSTSRCAGIRPPAKCGPCARLQAAQVGLAQADFLPALDGRVAQRSRVRIDSRSATQRNSALTLSWLLFDFGARSANLEVARQLMSAATATLDATVQNVFLERPAGLLQCPGGARRGHRRARIGKASRESLTAAEVRYRSAPARPADRLQAQTAWSQATLTRIRAEGVQRNTLGAWPTSWDSTPTSRCYSTTSRRPLPGAASTRRRGADRRSARAPPRTQGRRSRTEGGKRASTTRAPPVGRRSR